MNKFIDEVYKSDLIDPDYLEFLDKAILTYYIRQERFCDGLWGTAAKDGTFLKILKRLRQLITY